MYITVYYIIHLCRIPLGGLRALVLHSLFLRFDMFCTFLVALLQFPIHFLSQKGLLIVYSLLFIYRKIVDVHSRVISGRVSALAPVFCCVHDLDDNIHVLVVAVGGEALL